MIATAVPCVVLDTNVWLDGLVFADARVAALFAALRAGACTAASNGACRAEWQRVLGYSVFNLDPPRRIELEAGYDALAARVDADQATPLRLPRCRDPDDQKFLELACAVRATALLTRDADLLRLARRCRREAGFAIMLPESFSPPAS